MAKLTMQMGDRANQRKPTELRDRSTPMHRTECELGRLGVIRSMSVAVGNHRDVVVMSDAASAMADPTRISLQSIIAHSS
jgi:hypothetical protein